MKPLALFPASERDETFLLEPKTQIASIVDAIRSIQIPLLEQFNLIDLYSSETTRNATFRFIYRDRSKTVSLDEVKAAHDTLVEHILSKTKGYCSRQPLP
jgi:phenylalanyl-tRNA synthetase beta subunit